MTYKMIAERLVASKYASDMKPVPYGLTKQTTYEVFVEHDGWQIVDPYGNLPHSKAQYWALQDYAAMLGELS